MSTAAFPLVDGWVTSPDPGNVPTDNNGGATMGATMGPNLSAADVAAIQGTGQLTGAHNTPLHVAGIGIVALLVIIGLRLAGFRFSMAGHIGR